MPQNTIQKFDHVKSVIKASCAQSGRRLQDVSLVVVSKTFDGQAIELILRAGHRIFGENKVQEAESKWPILKDTYPDSELHLIGPLQTNKARRAADIFECIETLDREKLAIVLARLFQETGKCPRLLVQVNTGGEIQKSGVQVQELDSFIVFCRDELKLPVDGLMCIPPAEEEASLHFALLSKLAKRNNLAQLSMGMSSNYDTAIAFGATLIRVGSAIFGPRENSG